MGNLGSEAEMRYTPNGKAITSFSVAVSRKYAGDGGEDREETEWLKVVAWDKLAETCNKNLYKGDAVFVVGRVHLATWIGTDKAKHSRLELIANTVTFLSKKHEDAVEDVNSDHEDESVISKAVAAPPPDNGAAPDNGSRTFDSLKSAGVGVVVANN